MSYFLILFALVAIGAVIYLSKSKGKATSTVPALGGGIAKIRGNGRFEVDVVGESFYKDSFVELARRHKPTNADSESFGDAVLSLDDKNPHDRNAVAVHIEGLQVGHLSRSMAVDFRKAIARDGLQQHRQFAVAARLYWGGDEGLRSVSLDLPQA